MNVSNYSSVIAQWNIPILRRFWLAWFNAIRKIAPKQRSCRCSVFRAGQRLRDEASGVQPSASVARGGQWWDLSQNPVLARTPNLIGVDKVASVVAIGQIWQPMSAHVYRVQAAQSIEFRADSDLERVPPTWLRIPLAYMKRLPVASESCPWTKSGPLDP
jgi:hypothetical protein